MSYCVSFSAKLENTDTWVPVGDEWITHTWNTADMINAVCGSTPYDWNEKRCSEMIPILEAGTTELRKHGNKYLKYEDKYGWGTVESTLHFLNRILENCKQYPTAVVSVC